MTSLSHSAAAAQRAIRVRGARVHNLKNISVDLPRDKLVVLTGLSGSGKSSLAFDTVYAEGQRRYVESLSSYARQFLEMQDKPDVDLIEGLSPAISIEQKTTSKNPRSTVATVTEIYDYLRLLYGRVGKPICYSCGEPIARTTATQMVDRLMEKDEGTRLSILSPIVRHRKGEYKKELAELRKEGFVRVRVDGEQRMLDEDIVLEKNKKHTIEVVVDRVVVKPDARLRIADAVDLATKKAGGLVIVVEHNRETGDSERMYSENFGCDACDIAYPEIEPRLFSFNAPQGACPTCDGLGAIHDFDLDLVIPDTSKSLKDGAIKPWSGGAWGAWYAAMFKALSKHFEFSLTTPWKDLAPAVRDVILNGTDQIVKFTFDAKGSGNTYRYAKPFEGVLPQLKRRFQETTSERQRDELQKYMMRSACPDCKGARLRVEARHVLVGGRPLHTLGALSIGEAAAFFDGLMLGARDAKIGEAVLKEIRSRLGFLVSVGLTYLTLDRGAATLSGGEAQRIRLATQIGSALVGVLYVLDEPSIGLHQRDNEKLLHTLEHLRDLGNTVLVVEHDEDTIRAADHLVDLGPGAGHEGGDIVFSGPPAAILDHETSLTGGYLSRRLRIPIPDARRKGQGKTLAVRGATGNNLQNVDMELPLGKLVCVTGVSGSGKSSLTLDTVYRSVSQALYGTRDRPLPFRTIDGLEHVDKVIDIDQSPIGRTPRSNPATYTGIFDEIRKLFAKLPDSQVRGWGPGRFSFNVKGGRCEACQGDGVIKIEMNFLPDVYVTCEECHGKRYNVETLSVKYKDKSISDVLNMTVAEARQFFAAIPALKRRLALLESVGLGYIHLGQPATTLSGGEAQRIKLSKELSRRATGRTLYFLDEPTTGLHFHDVKQLLEVLHRLADQGNTVVVIEHNLDVIKTADWVIDLGPEGGSGGGQIIAQGTPEHIAQVEGSHTGHFLREVFERDGHDLSERPETREIAPDEVNRVRGRRAKAERIQKQSETEAAAGGGRQKRPRKGPRTDAKPGAAKADPLDGLPMDGVVDVSAANGDAADAARTALRDAFAAGRTLKSADAQALTGLNAAGVRPLLAALVEAGACSKEGKGRGVRYVGVAG